MITDQDRRAVEEIFDRYEIWLAGDTAPSVDIRERFEAWAKLSSMSLAKNSDDEYVNLAVHGAWSAWQAGQSDVDYINWRVPVEDTSNG